MEMKIALCISGGLRNYKDTHYSVKHFLLDCNNVDIFYYGLENKEGKEQNIKDFTELYNPKKIVINKNDFYDQIPCRYHIKSSFYGFYNVLKCNELKSNYEEENKFKYDFVIRVRPDYFWFRSITSDEFEAAKENVLTPERWSFKCVQPFAQSDIFAIGSSELMDQYSSLFSKIDDYCNNFPFHPESLCGYHLKVNNIPSLEIKEHVLFEYPSVRTEFIIEPYKFIKYFPEPNIENTEDLVNYVSNMRRNF